MAARANINQVRCFCKVKTALFLFRQPESIQTFTPQQKEQNRSEQQALKHVGLIYKSELWFDSIENAQAAFASEIGQQAYDDVPNFAENVAVTYITETQKF
ncbi:EthD family reductase [Testudinibacter sp. TR-2022]|nr:EthD family reductase [Pasteurellaceae bacterium Phil31]TNH10554.1 EthD family reductase [Testudinibacter sp. TR-2022]TNH10968.1 EthD family reductase [Testudinibacter sp. TR-2022]TNH13625.1 EthD family reductase [Testudinibacter sp. TR-2022]TNH18167.1 EthD family reductase [Testudinibacter sp. TR-2022]